MATLPTPYSARLHVDYSHDAVTRTGQGYNPIIDMTRNRSLDGPHPGNQVRPNKSTHDGRWAGIVGNNR